MKSVLLIGLGRFGSHIAEKLNELHHQVMAVDKNEQRINDALPLKAKILPQLKISKAQRWLRRRADPFLRRRICPGNRKRHRRTRSGRQSPF